MLRPEQEADGRVAAASPHDPAARRAVSLPDRAIRAAHLDSRLYAQVRGDRAATGQALRLAAPLALAHGLGSATRGFAFGWHPLTGALFGLQGELLFFAAASGAAYVVGRYPLGGTATYGPVLRPFGFAGVPGILILAAALVSLTRTAAEVAVFAVLVGWRSATGFVAVRQALGLGRVRSAIALIGGGGVGLAADRELRSRAWDRTALSVASKPDAPRLCTDGRVTELDTASRERRTG